MNYRNRAVQVVSGVLVLSQVVAMVLFLKFVRAADAAMDKTGIGDLDVWNKYNARASDALWGLAGAWIAGLGFALAVSNPWRRQLLVLFGIVVPLVVIVLYVANLTLLPHPSAA